MSKKKFYIEENDDFWSVIKKINDALEKQKLRKRFTKWIKDAVLFRQNYRCNICFDLLEFPEYDHIDGERSNNSYQNCQALCPNCHAKKTRQARKPIW